MADRPPPGRYSVVERGGRLVVIDRETGRTPPSAVERMVDYDRRMGNEPPLPAAQRFPTDAFADPSAPVIERVIEPPLPPVSDRMVATVTAMNRKQPWKDQRPAAAAGPDGEAQFDVRRTRCREDEFGGGALPAERAGRGGIAGVIDAAELQVGHLRRASGGRSCGGREQQSARHQQGEQEPQARSVHGDPSGRQARGPIRGMTSPAAG